MTRPSRPTLQGKFTRKLDSHAEPSALPAPDAAQQAAAIKAEFAASMGDKAKVPANPIRPQPAVAAGHRDGGPDAIQNGAAPSTGRGRDYPILTETPAISRGRVPPADEMEPTTSSSAHDTEPGATRAPTHTSGEAAGSLAELKARILGARRTRGAGEARATARTSLRIDEDVFRRLKQLALDENTTQEKLIEVALIDLFERKAKARG